MKTEMRPIKVCFKALFLTAYSSQAHSWTFQTFSHSQQEGASSGSDKFLDTLRLFVTSPSQYHLPQTATNITKWNQVQEELSQVKPTPVPALVTIVSWLSWLQGSTMFLQIHPPSGKRDE